jgi:hypothetical protein
MSKQVKRKQISVDSKLLRAIDSSKLKKVIGGNPARPVLRGY